jgi:hypothetical protein
MEENWKRYIERKMKEQRKEKGNSDADNEGNVCQRRGFRIKKICNGVIECPYFFNRMSKRDQLWINSEI